MNQASIAFQISQMLKAVYGFCLVFSLFDALHAIPSVALITSALATAVVPLLELAVVIGVVSVLLAMLLLIEAPASESLTTPPLLLSYMLNGIISGTTDDALCMYLHQHEFIDTCLAIL